MKAKRSTLLIRPILAAALLIAWGGGRVAQAADEPQRVASMTQAAQAGVAPASRGMDELVSLDFKSTDVVDALKYLALKGSLNLSTSKTVSGRVNLSLTDVPIRDVFEIILRSNGLAYMKLGSVYHVMTEEEYRALYGRKFSDLREIKTFKLQYAGPEAAFNMLDALKSDIGRLLVDEETGTVLIMDTPAQLQRMEEALTTLEHGAPVRVFDLRYAKAKEVEERLKDQIELKKLGYVKADERSNQVVVKTLPDRMKDVERLIAALDQKTREVLIDVKIVSVTLTQNLDTGIDWDSVFTNFRFYGIDKIGDFRTVATSTAAALTHIPIGTHFKLGSVAVGSVVENGYELIRYLERIGETKIVSTPHVLVTNNQEAKIHVGTREAYVTTTTTTGQTTSTTAEEVQFIDVGIQLSVTPTINSDGYVTMKIKPEVSSVVRTLQTPSRNQIPIVDTSSAETQLMVKDGVTIVLGGLARDQKQFQNRQIPIVARVPLVGELFRRRSRADQRQELVVFITPHIVQGDELVSGEEKGLNLGVKPYRDYNPLLEKQEVPPVEESEEPQEATPPSGVRLPMREKLRGYSGND